MSDRTKRDRWNTFIYFGRNHFVVSKTDCVIFYISRSFDSSRINCLKTAYKNLFIQQLVWIIVAVKLLYSRQLSVTFICFHPISFIIFSTVDPMSRQVEHTRLLGMTPYFVKYYTAFKIRTCCTIQCKIKFKFCVLCNIQITKYYARTTL